MSDEPLDGSLFGEDQPCYGCGPQHPHGFRLRFERDGDEVVTRMTPGPTHQGAPGIMHGGLVATLADEIAAWAIISELGKFGFTGSFDARYRQAVRIGVPIEGRGRITSTSRRVVGIDVRILQGGREAFTGAFKFVVLGRAGAEQLLGGAIPDAWARFCR